MRANLPGRAASCVRRSKIKEKAGKPCGPARHVRAVRKFGCAGFVPRAPDGRGAVSRAGCLRAVR
ncbi:hypothetical protein DF053_06625 [Burkholderia cepacia]|nr:hypothetical protein DF053_06625 [Burkholderia cepacia]